MTKETLFTRFNKSTSIRAGALAMAAGFTLSACGDSEPERASSASTSPSQPPKASSTSAGANTKTSEFKLVFDDLGGGSSIIQVYPGVTKSVEDKQFNGTFNVGDTVTAICKSIGRSVNSVPGLGERNARSDQWIKIAGSPGLTQYATAVYVENPAELLQQLPGC